MTIVFYGAAFLRSCAYEFDAEPHAAVVPLPSRANAAGGSYMFVFPLAVLCGARKVPCYLQVLRRVSALDINRARAREARS